MALPIVNIMMAMLIASMAGHIGEISVNVLSLDNINTLEDTITARQKDVATTQVYIDSSITGNVTHLTELVLQAEQDILALLVNFTLAELNETDGDINSPDAVIVFLFEQLDKGIAELESTMVTIQKQLVTIQRNITVDQTSVINIQSTVTGLINTINTTTVHLNVVQVNITTMFSTLRSLNFTVNITSINNQLSAIDAALTTIEGNLVILQDNYTVEQNLLSDLLIEVNNIVLFGSFSEVEAFVNQTESIIGLVGSGGELLTSSDTKISTEVLVTTIDNSDFTTPIVLTLADPVVAFVQKRIRILYLFGAQVVIRTSKGQITLDQYKLETELMFIPKTGWVVLDQEKPNFFAYYVYQNITSNQTVAVNPTFGSDTALSCDGLTLVVGASNDNSANGATLVFKRSSWNDTFRNPAQRLIGTGASGLNPSAQGFSVAISCDGRTVAIGAPNEDYALSDSGPNYVGGAVWVFYDPGTGVFAQQGSKLIATGGTGSMNFGSRMGTWVEISGDGNTIIAGGPEDGHGDPSTSNPSGAVWIFKRNVLLVWSQFQMIKATSLCPSLCPGYVTFGVFGEYGTAVAMNYDATTIAFSAISFSQSSTNMTGAVFVFGMSGASYVAQVSSPLIGPPPYGIPGVTAVGGDKRGQSISLSADGSTLAFGAPGYKNGQGGVAIYTRVGTTWNMILSITSTLLAPTDGAFMTTDFGQHVQLTPDGSTLYVTGFGPGNQLYLWEFLRVTVLLDVPKYVQRNPATLLGSVPLESAPVGKISSSSDGSVVAIGKLGNNIVYIAQ